MPPSTTPSPEPPHRVLVVPQLRRVGRLLLRDWLAITIGSRILAWRDLNGAELAHELEHVRQWQCHGWRFPALYLAASVSARRGTLGWYAGNRFELAARAAAERAAR